MKLNKADIAAIAVRLNTMLAEYAEHCDAFADALTEEEISV